MTYDHSKSKEDARNALDDATIMARDLVEFLSLGDVCDLYRGRRATYEQLMAREPVQLGGTADVLDTLENLAREIADSLIEACAWVDDDHPSAVVAAAPPRSEP